MADYKWTKDTDPDGGSHWIREKKETKGQKAGKVYGKVSTGFRGILPILLLIILFRWYMAADWGFADENFVAYPDGSGLYYFDVFRFLKSIAISMSTISDSFHVFISGESWSSFSMAFPDFVWNVLAVVINFILFMVKSVMLLPLSLVGTILGGFFNPWIRPGGWIYEFIRWQAPYVNTAQFWEWLRMVFVEWSQAMMVEIVNWWNGVWNTIQNWFASWVPWLS